MKITKLMLSALVAAAALVSCNKEDQTPVETGVKSVSISFENAIMTKSASNGQVSGAVTVNNFKIFLLDKDDNEYNAYTITAEGKGEIATTYFSQISTLPSTINLHYIDPAVTRIAIIANAGDLPWGSVKDGYALDITYQQDPTALTLYGEDNDLEMAEEKKHLANGDVTVLYTAAVTLSPTVSRFEVDGFRIGFDPNNPKFNSVLISQIAFQNYYPASDAVSGTASGPLTAHISDLGKDSVVYDWFNATKEAAWYWDNCNLTLTPSSSVGKVGTKGLAYHFFAGNKVPVMVIDMVADGRPAYVYSKSFKVIKDGTATTLDKLEAGKVYRMSAEGADKTTDPNGYIEIPEVNIEPGNHCIDITVSVVDWVVTLVQPEF